MGMVLAGGAGARAAAAFFSPAPPPHHPRTTPAPPPHPPPPPLHLLFPTSATSYKCVPEGMAREIDVTSDRCMIVQQAQTVSKVQDANDEVRRCMRRRVWAMRVASARGDAEACWKWERCAPTLLLLTTSILHEMDMRLYPID
jgi:hypothetical protein